MNSFGEALKSWRKLKGLSQLDLSLQAGISSKHISFLETSKSSPSKEMVLKLSNVLDVPLCDRNVLLALAGFSEAYSRMKLDQVEMSAVNHALDKMLEAHSPYPAMVFDWDWNILKANKAQLILNDIIKSVQPNFPDSQNIMDLLFDPNGYRGFIKNWEEVALALLIRIQKEEMLQPDRFSTLLNRLLSYDGVSEIWESKLPTSFIEPMLYIDFQLNGQELKLFSILASFGTAVDITMQEIIIEQYFPVDDSTKNFFNSIL